jgi:hypothetical protein
MSTQAQKDRNKRKREKMKAKKRLKLNLPIVRKTDEEYIAPTNFVNSYSFYNLGDNEVLFEVNLPHIPGANDLDDLINKGLDQWREAWRLFNKSGLRVRRLHKYFCSMFVITAPDEA